MATLYQLHTPMDQLKHGVSEIARLWRHGDSILLLGSTAAYIDWLMAYLADSTIQQVAGIYALKGDLEQLNDSAVGYLNLTNITKLLTDPEWVQLTQSADFDKVITIAL